MDQWLILSLSFLQSALESDHDTTIRVATLVKPFIVELKVEVQLLMPVSFI